MALPVAQGGRLHLLTARTRWRRAQECEYNSIQDAEEQIHILPGQKGQGEREE